MYSQSFDGSLQTCLSWLHYKKPTNTLAFLLSSTTQERLQVRQARSKPLAETFHAWMLLHRQKITDGSSTAKAPDYSLKRWGALTQFLENGKLAIDNNWIESQIRPIDIGRSNWLFAKSLRAGQRAAAVMSLFQRAKLNGHDPYACRHRLDIEPPVFSRRQHQIIKSEKLG